MVKTSKNIARIKLNKLLAYHGQIPEIQHNITSSNENIVVCTALLNRVTFIVMWHVLKYVF